MPKDDMIYLGHMLDMARKATSKLKGKSRDDYDRDEDLRMVLAHMVQTIGEAARHVSPETQATHPEIPWRRITGMRNRIIHDYLNIDEYILYQVVTDNLPELITLLEPLVPAEEP
jgi:uncharacterized protein with HEPN domain